MNIRQVIQTRTICALAILIASTSALAQEATPCSSAYRVLVRRWDAVLNTAWELRQSCAHPGWPARSVAVATTPEDRTRIAVTAPSIPALQPLLVHAGDSVTLWSQDSSARIEITGVAEQSAHRGDRITVRVTHQSDENGLTSQQIAGIVRDAASVEIAQ